MLKTVCGLAGLSLWLAQVVFFHLLRTPVTTPVEALAVIAGLALLIFAAAWFPLNDALHAIGFDERPLSWRARLAAVVAIAAVAVVAIPIKPDFVRDSRIEVTTDGGNTTEGAPAAGVSIRVAVDGRDIPFAELVSKDGWMAAPGTAALSLPAHRSSLSWEGTARRGELVVAWKHWSGRLQVTQDGRTEMLDVSPGMAQGGETSIPLFGAHHGGARKALRNYATLLDALLIGALVVAGFETLAGRLRWKHRVVPGAEYSLRRDIVAFAAIPACASLALLMLFAPAIMTSDSSDQWMQLTNHRLNDWHPPLHTLLNGALRIVWDSPAVVAAAQAAAMAAAAGSLIAVTRRALAAPRWAAYLGSALFAFHPITSLLTITLWKDVFYTAGVIFIVAGAIAMASLDRRPLERVSGIAGALVACIVCLAFRHNGGPFVVCMGVLLLILVRDQRRRTAAVLAVAIVLHLLINGPLMAALGVTKVHIPFTIASHHIAAHLAAGEEPESSEDKALLASIGQWSYNCATVDATIFNKAYKSGVASANASRLVAIAMRMALASPQVEANHLACVSSLVWRIGTRPGEPYYLSTTGLYLRDDGVHWMYRGADRQVEQSPVRAEGEPIRRFLIEAGKGNWFNRPALYLYLLLFASAVAWKRNPSRWVTVACIVTAVLGQSASLMFFNVAQDARYQLPVYVIALCLVPCLLFAQDRSRAAH